MSFDIVCFDCDSTLSRIEGIDELARSVGQFDKVAELTNAAMNGDIAIEEVYGQRLALIKPHIRDIDALAALYIREIVEGVFETVTSLLSSGKEVHIISGGLRQAILPLASHLSIPASHVHAVDIFFHADGSYMDYAVDSPLSRSGGKATICRYLSDPKKSMVLVGDGKTDLEAKEAGATVIGFGGVVRRSIVESACEIYITDTSLTSVLPYILK